MSRLLTTDQIDQFKADGVVRINGKFDKEWIKKLKEGISKDFQTPSPRSLGTLKMMIHQVTLKIFGLGIFSMSSKISFTILQQAKLLQS